MLIEQFRGLDYTEDLFTHGRFEARVLKEGDKTVVLLFLLMIPVVAMATVAW